MKRAFLIFGLTAASVFAQPEIKPENLKAAKELTTIMGLDKQMQSGFSAMMPMIDGLAKRMNLKDEEAVELRGIYQTWFATDLDQKKLADTVTNLYAESFTVDELNQLTTFYKSPIGQKTLVTLPELMKKSSVAGMEEAKSKQDLLQKRLQPFIEAHMPKPAGAPEGAPAPAPAPTTPAVPAPKAK